MTSTIGSLCSGAGGLELGIERALGARTIWQAEPDPHASTVLAHHWPSVPNLGDITTVDWAQVETPDVVCFGFPCQDISSAGRRAGLEGEKSALWFDCADAVRVLRPRYLLVENVSALLTRGLDRVLGDLAEMGYVGRWGCIRSSDVGAPHRRERIFVAAAHTEQREGRERHDPHSIGGRQRQAEQAGMGDRSPAHPHSAGTGRNGRSAPGAQEPDRRCQPHHTHTPGAHRAAAPDPAGEGRRARHSLNGDGTGQAQRRQAQPGRRGAAPAYTEDHGRHRPGTPRGGRPESAHSDSAPADTDSSRFGTVVVDLSEGQPDSAWGVYATAIRRWEAVHGAAPSPRDDKGRLNPQLSAWMMGFEPGWVTDPAIGIPRTAQLRLVGNACQPQVAELAARLLLAPLMQHEGQAA